MNIFFLTFGCKVNSSETESMAVIAEKNNYILTEDMSKADIIVINSCTVTKNSDRKVLACVRKIKREFSNAIIVLTGCLPQAYGNVKNYGADIVIGNTNKFEFIRYIQQYIKDLTPIISIEEHKSKEALENIPIPKMRNHTRAFLKVEDGCDRYCTYCIVPFARGYIRSLSPVDIQKQATLFASNNCKEIVLTGINLSSYGKGTEYTLADAVTAADVNGIERIRLSSLEPDLLSDEIIYRLGECKKLCDHFHLSLQSGSNSVLASMNRKYTVEEYTNVICKIKKVFPFSTFTTDIMVGFPTETEEDFNRSIQLLSSIEFLKCHVFCYSPRPMTKAAELKQIPERIKKERMQQMLLVADETRRRILLNQIGTTARIVVEEQQKKGYFEGYTDRYIPVRIYENLNTGDLIDVHITSLEDDRCIAVSV